MTRLHFKAIHGAACEKLIIWGLKQAHGLDGKPRLTWWWLGAGWARKWGQMGGFGIYSGGGANRTC